MSCLRKVKSPAPGHQKLDEVSSENPENPEDPENAEEEEEEAVHEMEPDTSSDGTVHSLLLTRSWILSVLPVCGAAMVCNTFQIETSLQNNSKVFLVDPKVCMI